MSKSKGLSTIIVILITVVLMAVSAIGGYYYGTNTTATTTSLITTARTTPSKITTTSAVSATTTAVDETAGWKTYENKEYGFSFKYPVDWEYKEDTLNAYIELGEKGKTYYYEGTETAAITVSIDKRPESKTATEYEKAIKAIKEEKNITEQEIRNKKIAGTDGIEIYDYLGTRITFYRNNIEYRIWFNAPAEGINENKYNEYLKIYNQILSAFKFTP